MKYFAFSKAKKLPNTSTNYKVMLYNMFKLANNWNCFIDRFCLMYLTIKLQ